MVFRQDKISFNPFLSLPAGSSRCVSKSCLCLLRERSSLSPPTGRPLNVNFVDLPSIARLSRIFIIAKAVFLLRLFSIPHFLILFLYCVSLGSTPKVRGMEFFLCPPRNGGARPSLLCIEIVFFCHNFPHILERKLRRIAKIKLCEESTLNLPLIVCRDSRLELLFPIRACRNFRRFHLRWSCCEDSGGARVVGIPEVQGGCVTAYCPKDSRPIYQISPPWDVFTQLLKHERMRCL